MSASLIEKMRAAREEWAEVDGKGYKIRRPTELEMVRGREGSGLPIGLEMVTKIVVDWRGITEADLIPSGSTDPVQFSQELWSEYASDRPELWLPIGNALISLTERHHKHRESELKN